MSVSERKFGVLQTGETVKIFHLENGEIRIIFRDIVKEDTYEHTN